MPKRLDVDEEEIVRRYLAGDSMEKISRDLTLNRFVVKRRLDERGIELRPRSMEDFWAGRRGQKASDEELAKKALTRHQQVSPAEVLFGEWLLARGIDFDPQEPFGPYNIDLGTPDLAIEIHTNTNHPLRWEPTAKRVRYFLENSRSVLYVWVSGRHILTEHAADFVVEILRNLDPDHPDYWVVRGTGYPVTDRLV